MADGINKNIYLVNAPAGSGKTTTIRKMVEEHLQAYPDDNILCITYTNRAAEELEKDIYSKNVFFGTIHAFINHFIKSFFSHKDILELYWQIYKNEIEDRINNVAGKESISESNQRYIERYGQLDMETVKYNIQTISYNEAPYNSLFKGALSHDDLISFARKVVDLFPVIRRKISDKYQLIFIDEYQDTTDDVLHIFYNSMIDGNGKLFLIGDRMQQIYKNYNGTFEKEFLRLNCSVNLKKNYRTTPHIVSILNFIYNDSKYVQCAYEKNSDEVMNYKPEVIISSNVEEVLKEKQEEYPEILVLYLLNKERFFNIGSGHLYLALKGMDKYSFGRKYGVVDVLTNMDNTNPDKLFTVLFLIATIESDYKRELYGKVFHTIKENKKKLNTKKYTMKQHYDKSRIKKQLDKIFYEFGRDDVSIKEFMSILKASSFIDFEYIEEILGDQDYNEVLEIPILEFRNLLKYLKDPHSSTQHGVKGESHDTVAFLVDNSNNNPVVHMNDFLMLWSNCDVCLSEFEKFYYDYKNLIVNIEENIGMKCSDMKSLDYKNKEKVIFDKAKEFAESQSNSSYYKYLLKNKFDIYFQKKGVTKAKECLRENLVYGALSAYKLFYVGCSRARKNLTIIINKSDISSFKDKLIDKFKLCGFKVIQK